MISGEVILFCVEWGNNRGHMSYANNMTVGSEGHLSPGVILCNEKAKQENQKQPCSIMA